MNTNPSDAKSTYLIVEPFSDPTAPNALSLSAHVSADYGSGYIAFAGDGAVKQAYYPSWLRPDPARA